MNNEIVANHSGKILISYSQLCELGVQAIM